MMIFSLPILPLIEELSLLTWLHKEISLLLGIVFAAMFVFCLGLSRLTQKTLDVKAGFIALGISLYFLVFGVYGLIVLCLALLTKILLPRLDEVLDRIEIQNQKGVVK